MDKADNRSCGEDGDGESGAHGWMPVVALWVDIEVAKSCGDEGVYYGEGIGDDVKNCYVDQQIGLGS